MMVSSQESISSKKGMFSFICHHWSRVGQGGGGESFQCPLVGKVFGWGGGGQWRVSFQTVFSSTKAVVVEYLKRYPYLCQYSYHLHTPLTTLQGGKMATVLLLE